MIIEAQKISKKSLFKLLFIGNGLGFLLFFLVCGVAAIFGAQTVNYNNEAITGIAGLGTALVMWPFFSLFFTCFIWLSTLLGLWIYSKFKLIRVTFVNASVVPDESR